MCAVESDFAECKLGDVDIISVPYIGVGVVSSLYSDIVHCMNISCMSCVHDMTQTHYFAHVVWRVGSRFADVRFAEFLVVVRRLFLSKSEGTDQISGRVWVQRSQCESR